MLSAMLSAMLGCGGPPRPPTAARAPRATSSPLSPTPSKHADSAAVVRPVRPPREANRLVLNSRASARRTRTGSRSDHAIFRRALLKSSWGPEARNRTGTATKRRRFHLPSWRLRRCAGVSKLGASREPPRNLDCHAGRHHLRRTAPEAKVDLRHATARPPHRASRSCGGRVSRCSDAGPRRSTPAPSSSSATRRRAHIAQWMANYKPARYRRLVMIALAKEPQAPSSSRAPATSC